MAKINFELFASPYLMNEEQEKDYLEFKETHTVKQEPSENVYILDVLLGRRMSEKEILNSIDKEILRERDII